MTSERQVSRLLQQDRTFPAVEHFNLVFANLSVPIPPTAIVVVVMMQSSRSALSAAISAIPKPQTCTNVRCRPHPHTKLRLRGFTSSATTQGMVQSARMPRDIASRMPSQPSMKTMMRNMAKSEATNDLGFLPQTFVYGSGTSHYPSIFREPRTRFRIEWFRMKQAGMGLFSLVTSRTGHRRFANP